jgi:hypothetical protein
MERILKLFFVFCLFISCVGREDIVFSASDELHLIFLYKESNEFELFYNGVNSAKGIYTLSVDTVFLKYNLDEDGISNSNSRIKKHANDILTRKLLIDKSSNKVKSIDCNSFCADIQIDKLNE